MSLFPGLFTGREALMSNGTAMGVVADNISNSNTVGFKEARAEFEDLLAESVGSLFGSPFVAGDGTAVVDISSIHTQGPIDFTNRELDAAISGTGFFVLNDGANNFYSRAGNFEVDADGNIVASSGENVMGFTTESPATLVPLNTTGVSSTATATTTAVITGNLDAGAPIVVPPAAPTSFSQLNTAANFHSSVSVLDSLGLKHEVGLYFFQKSPLTWQVDAYVADSEVGGTTSVPTQLGTTDMTFSATGTLPEGQAVALSISPAWTGGAQATAVSMDLSGFTGFGAESNVSSVVVNGNSAGQVAGIEIDTDGTVLARLDNGESTTIGSLALASFTNQGGLERIGENKFRDTEESGVADFGLAQTEGRGLVQGGALEQSTVDIAKEFVKMISIQQGYQAGAKVVSTVDELITTTLQLA